jgi:hypothetical protein
VRKQDLARLGDRVVASATGLPVVATRTERVPDGVSRDLQRLTLNAMGNVEPGRDFGAGIC